MFGAAAAVGCLLFESAARHFGPLSVVQPVPVAELVFLQCASNLAAPTVPPGPWASAGLTCLALAPFLAAAEPRGGNPGATASAWVGAISVFGGASVALTVSGAARVAGAPGSAVWNRRSRGRAGRHLHQGITNVLSMHGAPATLTSWPLYAVSVASGLLVQAACTSPLTVSQPLLVMIDPIVSIWLSIWLFAEYFSENSAVIAGRVVLISPV